MSLSRPIRSWTRLLLSTVAAAAVVVAMLIGATVPASAQEQAPATTSAARKAPAKAAPAASAPAQAGQRAFIDPKTGKLREPEIEEIAALQPAKRKVLKAAPVQTLKGPKGEVGAVVPEDLQMFAVVTRNADGSLSFTDVQGKANADALVKAGGKKAAPKTEVK